MCDSQRTVSGLILIVQLIIFLGAIRKTLKKEIYGCDKRYFMSDENKGPVPTAWRTRR
jgi:hypothetical protein